MRFGRCQAGLLAILCVAAAAPAHAITAYPGETSEAFAARARLDQAQRRAEADAAAGGVASGFGDSASAPRSGLGMLIPAAGFGLLMVVMWGIRLSMAVNRASRSFTRATGMNRLGDSFEERVADSMREMQRNEPLLPVAQRALPGDPPAAPPPAATLAPPRPASPRAAPGPRTFGRRA